MDYAKMLFVSKVRAEAMHILELRTKNMERDEIDEFSRKNLPEIVASIVDNMKMYATLVEKAFDQRASEDARAYYEKLGRGE